MTESETFAYQGLSVTYQKTGRGRPVVILHGWGSSSRVMMPLAEQLAHLRTCYVPDLPGFGATGPPERSWSIDDYADLVQNFIEEKLDEPADLLVHSFGGRIALKLCARPFAGEYIGKVLITGGAGMKPRRSLRFYLKKYMAKALKAPVMLLPEHQKGKASDWLRSTKLWKALGSGDYARLEGVMRETFVKSVSEFLEPCLPLISHEVLLLWGREDEATPLYQAERMEAGMDKAALVVLENAGHYAFLDRPKRFASIAEAFLKG